MTNRQKKRLITLLFALFVFGVGAFTEAAGWNSFQVAKRADQVILEPGTYQVTNIEDGDTITVDMNGNEERVRFIGVDTPEVRDPRKPVQCFGRAASAFTKDQIKERTVRLEADPENTNRDRYNRLLRYVYLPDNTLLNAEIIRQGYGFAYTSFPFTKKDEFKKLEDEARENNRGLWSSCKTGVDENGYNTINPDPNP